MTSSEDIARLVSDLNATLEDKRLVLSEAKILAVDLLRVAQSLAGDPLAETEVTLALLAAYDKFVEPLDLPGPDPLFDPLLRSVIPMIVHAIFEKVRSLT